MRSFWSALYARIGRSLFVLPWLGRKDSNQKVDVKLYSHVYRSIAEQTAAHLQAEAQLLPSFSAEGYLMPGVYLMSWQQCNIMFGWSARRKQLMAGLASQLEILAACGCRCVFIGGSLVSKKKKPDDFDGCWDLTGVDMSKLAALEPRLLASGAGQLSLSRAGGGALVPRIYSLKLGATFAEFLQFDIRTGKRKGIVAITLQGKH